MTALYQKKETFHAKRMQQYPYNIFIKEDVSIVKEDRDDARRRANRSVFSES